MPSTARASRLLRAGFAAMLAVAVLLPPLGASAQQPASRELPDVADVVDKVIDAVVYISTTARVEAKGQMPQLPPGSPFEEFFEEFFKKHGGEGNNPLDPHRQRRQTSLGSGFVIDPSGIIVTNNHVVEEADEIFVTFNDTTRLKAEVIGRDSKIDIAVLKVKADKPLKAVKLGDSDKLRLGEWVIAIGNPFGLGGTVTLGIVSARNRDISAGPYDNFIQTDAAINRGNSGGPLFSLKGEVVGINTAIISPSGGSIGIGFSVPSATASPVVEQLRNFGETRRGWIGVRIQQVTDEIAEGLAMGKANGALIAGVTDNGPAAKAGLKAGDVIVRFDGRDVKEMRDLPRVVAATPIGKSVEIAFLRGGKEQSAKVMVDRLEEAEKQAALDKPAPQQAPAAEQPGKVLGLELSTLTDELRKRFKIKDTVKGVAVTGVDRDSPASEKGLQPGQVIVEVAQEQVASPADVQRRLDALKKEGRKSVLILVANADGELRFVAVAAR
ncbi:DegQ family serine endoprotease [Blastochloris viridis]|uniref:Probable periplasmic serine endoprotease DegP-like n=1 Tax=Blastochloris viridis TaxID=1079 RepID=A0A0H5BG53_BLAVI|nr:DegQ family serine endoprotease [Blastochloris viridis]ALK10681.1 putative periplasmic serine endoprotease DegP-like precursor [Blastochloris viridis]BAR99356.1 HtrA protease/chaperone protein [Blastochloris viridis]CUU43344.1 putative periplasmic serine endoprotease DegP-like precursor [Blastochloris viridis]